MALITAAALAQDDPPGEGSADASAGPPQGPPPSLVRVAEARIQTVQQISRVTGKLQPVRRSLIASEESGRVILAPPDSGTVVEAGDKLACIDDEVLRIDRDGAAATVAEGKSICEEREALLSSATRERKRLEKLIADRTAKRKELEDMIDEEVAARAALAQARAALSIASTRLARTEVSLRKLTIRAPFDGFVTEKHTEVGQWLSPGDPVVEVVATGQIDAVFDVPEYVVSYVTTEQLINITIDALSQQRTAPVYRITPDANSQSRTFPVTVRLENADGTLKSGMTVTAELPNGKQTQALTVPRDAVQVTPNGARVYVNRGGVAAPANVRVRFGAGDRFVIDGPIGPGEQVVIEGNERLFPGAPLIVMPDAPAPEPSTPGTTAPQPGPQADATNVK